MATPPRIDDDRAVLALQAIAERRAAIDDPHREQLGDDPTVVDVLHVLSYLRKYSGAGTPEQVRRADVTDALRLRVWLWWYGASLERWLLERAEQLGMNRRELGRLLGIRTGQGLVDRRDRLQALLGQHGRPDEKVARAERAAGRATMPLPQRQQLWLDRHRAAVRAVAAALVEYRDLADDEAAEWLVEVARDLREQVCTPAAYTQIFYAVDAMATVPAVLALPDAHALRRALRDWQVLSAQYRRIRDTAGAA
ncbi:hypothetical protein ACFFX1_11250 [Dactylosporangium sucinum]|uniref:Uncharacterized protein n=1 Tax=Dactylosporangium sucinum TaxID=1424081 RepID=A0A917WQ26_9ACTN|nr:hypothetical protein [Dactylosporangium sucinum]GGM22254.1 hypothetical protein GCM10007977_024270 [Dactylosporangium sucinum]